MLDALAYEPHFLDHLAPVWTALDQPGRFLVPPELLSRAVGYGVAAEPLRVDMRRPAAGDPARCALVASYGDMKKARRLGYGSFAFLEHGIGQAYLGESRSSANGHPSYAGGIDRGDVGLFLVPNTYCAELWQRAYPGATVAVVGSPKLDTLPRREYGPGPVVAVSFHWNCPIAPETRASWSHFLPVLPELARHHRVIGHGHPRILPQLERFYRRMGIEVVPDFTDVCRRADLYVCDNSSTLYEFASTGRPVVVLNAPWYRRYVDHGLRFWEAATVGVQVDEPGDLLDGVERALADPVTQKAARHDALYRVYSPRGVLPSAVDRTVAAITEWLGSSATAAA